MNAVFAGSFDPFTLGHYSLVQRSLMIFDKVFVAVAQDNEKNSAHVMDRIKLAKLSLQDLSGAEVEGFSGYTTDFLKKKNTKVLIRGLRDSKDLAYEKYLFSEYKRMAEVEIIYLISDLPLVSSTEVRRRVNAGQSLDGFIKDNIKKEVIRIYKRRNQ